MNQTFDISDAEDSQLAKIRAKNREHLQSALHTYVHGGWEPFSRELAQFITERPPPQGSWMAEPVFLADIVPQCLQRGDGARLIFLLEKSGLEYAAAPVTTALQLAISGQGDVLEWVEPEIRAQPGSSGHSI